MSTATASIFAQMAASAASFSAAAKRKEAAFLATPWVEKYRPKTVDDVAFQDEVVEVLKKSIHGNDFPHLLLYGPPGTGKTSTILAVARQMFGPELMKTRVLELNASDERGIAVIREKVKTFAQMTASQVVVKGYPCPPFKIIILDEADSMTADAQSALRRTMETYSKTTRFCLICNYVSRIIEPLASRCAKFRFKPLNEDILADKLKIIAGKENVTIGSEAVEKITVVSGGDMRRAITILQSCFRLCGQEQIEVSDVVDVACIAPDQVIQSLWNACASNSFVKVQKAVKAAVASGYSAEQLLLQCFDSLVSRTDLDDLQKSSIALLLGESDRELIDGSDEQLQLLNVFATIMSKMHGSSKMSM